MASSSEMEESAKLKYGATDSRGVEAWTPRGRSPTTQTSVNSEDDRTELSPDQVLGHLGFGVFQLLAFLLSGFTYFAYGCDISIFVFIGESVRGTWNVTETQFALLPASTAVPNVLGALFFSYVSDRFGRWWPYALCVGWMGVFSVASAYSTSFVMLVVLRCCASFGIGGIPGIAFPTVMEFLPVRNRGSVGVMNMFMAVLGAVLSCGMAWWLIPSYPERGWRYYVTAVSIPTLLVAVFRLVFRVESPRYLIARGRFNRAWHVFKIIAWANRKRLTDLVTRDRFNHLISTTVDGRKIKQRSIFVQVLWIFHPSYLRSTLPLSVIIITESLGYLSAMLFLPDFLRRLGMGTYFTVMVTNLATLPGVLLMSIIIEWPEFGRLNSLRLFSFLAMLFFLLLTLVQTPLTIPLFLVFIFFSSGPLQGLIFTYISEVYPTSIRSITTSYFYILQAMTYMGGSLAGSKVANVPQHWVFPAFFTTVFFVQLCVSLVLNYEPKGKKLRDLVK